MEIQFDAIKKDIQSIIDHMAIKNFSEASLQLVQVSDVLDEMIDGTEDEVVLREISKYQVLLNHLQIKMSEVKVLNTLLPNTEISKNVSKQLIIRNFPSNLTKVV